MYLLSEMQYDYYEFETPVAVGNTVEILVGEFNRLMDEDRALGFGGNAKLVTDTREHTKLANCEVPHYHIYEIHALHEES